MAEQRPNNQRGAPLPYSVESEASVLGAILIDKDAVVKIADVLAADEFYDRRHQLIYEAMQALYEGGKPIDVLTLSNQLKTMKIEDGSGGSALDQAGGATYLTELTTYVPTATHVESYAAIVSEKSMRRRMSEINRGLAGLMLDETQDLAGLIEQVESQVFSLTQRHVKDSIVSIEEVLSQSFDRLDELHKDKGKTRGVPTGFRDMDNILAGLQRSDLFILAARPSMGKTAFSLNLAHNIAIAQYPVLFFSLEMSKEQLVDRLLSMESGVDAWALRTGNLTDSDFEKIGQAMGALSEAPMYIDDTPGITIQELRTKAKREAHKHQLGLIIVDYLQLMSGGAKFSGQSNRVQEISEISRGLKGVARELNVPLIALSQLSRSVETRTPQIPQLSDLRESGSIEQDADVVAFIYREEYYNPDTERKGVTDILIKKHRNGATGTVELYFDKDKQRFRGLDTHHGDPFGN